MVKDYVWLAVHPSGKYGALHLSCFEKRLGRPLSLMDLTDAPINAAIRYGIERSEKAERELAIAEHGLKQRSQDVRELDDDRLRLYRRIERLRALLSELLSAYRDQCATDPEVALIDSVTKTLLEP